MSDAYTTYLSLDCPPEDAGVRIDAVRELFTAAGYRDRSDATGDGVEYADSWHIADAGGNTGAATCPGCHTDNDDAMELVGQWFSTQQEPELRCPRCALEAPLGDWFGPDGEFGIFGCHASVTLWNEPPCSAELESSVRNTLGARVRKIHGRL